MAKKKSSHPFGLSRTSGLLRHVNKQTFGANAETEIAESIPNPAFGRGGVHTGMEISRILVVPDPLNSNLFGASAVNGLYQCQLQIGEAPSTPVVIDPQDEGLFAHLHFISSVSTNGGNAHSWPKMVPIINVVPVIIEQYFNVTHVGMNNSAYNDESVFTIIDYYTVEVPDAVYTQIALSRRDQS